MKCFVEGIPAFYHESRRGLEAVFGVIGLDTVIGVFNYKAEDVALRPSFTGEEASFQVARNRMVETQLKPRGIDDEEVLAAIRKVPRHRFVDRGLWSRAYSDSPLPIGEGQTISQPYMVALMTQCLELTGEERVLEIGTGSGYQAAVLAELSSAVFSVERNPELARRARRILTELGYDNVIITVGDGTLGWKEFAPYQRIMVTAGAPSVPPTLLEQLADGGRMVIPTGANTFQTLQIIQKKHGNIQSWDVCGCTFVPLIGREGWGNE